MKKFVVAGTTLALASALSGCSSGGELGEAIVGSAWECEEYSGEYGPVATWTIEFVDHNTVNLVDTADQDFGDTIIQDTVAYRVTGQRIEVDSIDFHTDHPQTFEWDGVMPTSRQPSIVTWTSDGVRAEMLLSKTGDGYTIETGQPMDQRWVCEAD